MLEFLSDIVVFTVPIIIVFYAHVIFHELGHLIAGIVTGYTFVSFRIGSWVLKKENNCFVIKKFTIPGTSGQCLLAPPVNRKEFSGTLYNLGGVIMNLLIAAISLVGLLYINNSIFLYNLCLFSALFGIFLALMNGIPAKVGGIANDGHNLLSLKKDSIAKDAFWLQLIINAKISEGINFCDLPAEWFNLPKDADANNNLICTIMIMECQYLAAKYDFTLAKQKALSLLETTPQLLPIFKNILYTELLFYELLDNPTYNTIEKYYTKEVETYFKATKYSPTTNRILYAYESLYKNNLEQANIYLTEFNNSLNNYPLPGEIPMEISFINLINQIHQNE